MENNLHVFLSHSTRDMESALRICSHLEDGGIICWMAPRDIRPGSDWAESIMRGIANARAMILLLTPNSNTSTQVRREVEHAVNAEIPIIPVILEGVEPSMALRYYISAHQWIDASGGLTDSFLSTLTLSLTPRKEPSVREVSEPGPAEKKPVAAPAPETGMTEPSPVQPVHAPPADIAPGSKHPHGSTERVSGRKPGAKKVLRSAVIILAVLMALLVLHVIRKRLHFRSVYRQATAAAESGEYTQALDLLEDLEGQARADSMYLDILVGGIRETHRIAAIEHELDPEGSPEYWIPVIALVQRYLQDTGFPDEPRTYQYMGFLAEAFSAFGSYEEAGNMLMEIVWNDTHGYLREEACIAAVETYLVAFSEENGIDSASVRINQLEALRVLHSDYPGNILVMPLGMKVALQCLESGNYEPAFEIARRIFTSHLDPGVRSSAAMIAAAALEKLGFHDEAELWQQRVNLADSLGVLLDESPEDFRPRMIDGSR